MRVGCEEAEPSERRQEGGGAEEEGREDPTETESIRGGMRGVRTSMEMLMSCRKKMYSPKEMRPFPSVSKVLPSRVCRAWDGQSEWEGEGGRHWGNHAGERGSWSGERGSSVPCVA